MAFMWPYSGGTCELSALLRYLGDYITWARDSALCASSSVVSSKLTREDCSSLQNATVMKDGDRATIFLLVGLAFLVISPGANADDRGREELVKMVDRRMALVSGRCTIRGSTRSAVEKQQDFTYHLIFDTSQSSLVLRKDNGPIFVRTREFQYYITSKGRAIKRIPLSECPRTPVLPFDIRGLGILARPSHSLTDIQFELLDFQKLGDYLLTAKIVGYRKEGSVARLTIRIPKRPQDDVSPLYRLWIDTKRGHSLIRFEQLDADVKPPKLLWWSELDWEKHGRVWVPVTFHQFLPHFAQYRDSWTIEWEQVNKPVDPKEFALKTFVPPGKDALVYFIEKPSNNVVRLGKIRGPSPDGTEPAIPRTFYFNWSTAMYVTGIALIVVACLIVMHRRWRR